MSKLYRLQLDDYSAPSFTSFGKDYFGTMEQIQSLFDCLRSDENFVGRFQYILGVNDRYLAGETDITHNVAYREVPFLVEAEVLSKAQSTLENFQWTHMNTWDCPYYMAFQKAENTQLWISCCGYFCRVIQTEFEGLLYGIEPEDLRPLGTMALGYPGQIELLPDGRIRNRLFVIDRYFDSREEAMEDYAKYEAQPNPQYATILDDIFGDG